MAARVVVIYNDAADLWRQDLLEILAGVDVVDTQEWQDMNTLHIPFFELKS